MPHDIFISYRREGSEHLAGRVKDALAHRGFSVFMDVEDLKSGKFNEALLAKIESAADFIIVLTPGCLERCKNENDWLRREIRYAITCKRNIVPIFARGFEMPSPETLPVDISELTEYNGLTPAHELFEASMNRLVSMFLKSAITQVAEQPDEKSRRAVVETSAIQSSRPGIVHETIYEGIQAEQVLEWKLSDSPILTATANLSGLLLDKDFRISQHQSKNGERLLFDSEFIYLANSDAKTVRCVIESSRVLDATLSFSGRYILAALGETIIRIDLQTNKQLEVKRDLESDAAWNAVHKDTLENRNYWAYGPEMIYGNVAVSEEAKIFAGSRKHYIPDGEGGYGYSEGFESIDLFDLAGGTFIDCVDCMDPGVLAFSSDGKFLIFGKSGCGVACYDVKRKKSLWQRWPEDNIELEEIHFVPPRWVTVGSRYAGFSSGFRIGSFNLASGNEQKEIDHLEWSQTPKDPWVATCIECNRGSTYFCLYDEKRNQSVTSDLFLGYNNGVTGGEGNGIYLLSNGSLSAYNEFIGLFGATGTFIQTSGTNTISLASGFLEPGQGGPGTYYLSGGTVSAAALELGGIATGNGTILQTGGGATFTDAYIAAYHTGSVGTYLLQAGTLSVGNLYIGGLDNTPGGTGVLTVSGTGQLTVTGMVQVYSAGRVNIDGGVSTMGSLSILSGGVININDILTIDYGTGNPSPMPTIFSYLQTGYDHGKWDGTGIISSLAANNATGSTTLGFVDTGSQIEIMYTWLGDLTLSGVVNSTDLALMNSGNGTSWALGDLNYDGVKNADDYALFMLGAAASGGMNISTTLPEPMTTLPPAILAILFPRRCRLRPN